MKLSAKVSGQLDSAILAMASGNLPAVERICREIVEADPSVAKAHVMLGIVAQRTGRPDESIARLTHALELDPSSFDAATCLVAAYRLSGDIGKAAGYAELAVRLRPDDPVARNEFGSLCMESLRFIEAEEQLRAAVRLSGGGLHELLLLNQCLDQMGKRAEAEQLVRQALASYKIPVEELVHQVPIFWGRQNPVAAVEFGREAVKQAPNLLGARSRYVWSLIEAGRSEEANMALEPLVLSELSRAESEDSEAMATIGLSFQSVGKIEQARNWLRLALGTRAPAALAYYGFASLGRIEESDADFVRLVEDRLADNCAPPDRPMLHFALGKSYEDLGRNEEAMVQYEAANGTQELGKAKFDRNFAPQHADRVAWSFTPEWFSDAVGKGSTSELPILIAGMMRSGTTLMEQVLASHPDVGGAGEVPYWSYNAFDLLNKAGGLRLDRLRESGDRYANLLEMIRPGKRRVVDKMPPNFKYLGLIHVALPNARLIHMRRNPVDTCVSIYSTYSRALTMFGYDKTDLVATYRDYREAMARWRELLPSDRLLDVDYEELVGNPEPTIRRILEFCDLEWNEACLHPESNPRAVATPSIWQVRRPFNTRSVGRWKKFEPWLGEFRDLLEEFDDEV